MDTINDRFAKVVSRFFKQKQDAATFFGWHKSQITNLINGKPVSSAVIFKIATSLPDVNLDWFIHGRGPMIWPEGYGLDEGDSELTFGIIAQKEEPRAAAEDAAKYAVSEGEQRLVAMLEYNQKEMQEMRREIDFLKVQMAKRDRGRK